MADPRFFDNRGPFTVAQLCEASGAVPAGIDPGAVSPGAVSNDGVIQDVASLAGAGPSHLAFCAGSKAGLAALAQSQAGFCLVSPALDPSSAPAGMVLLQVREPQAAFAVVSALFYPEYHQLAWAQQTPVDPTAELGDGVVLGPGVVIGPHAEVGDRTRIGAGAVIGPGVAIGRDCEIGAHVSITHAYLGDGVIIFPGVRIGQPGFGFVSSAKGHGNVPQLGRVIVQDRVEIGANSAVDRGGLGDTVIGEGTKIDNLVHIGHNCHIGRHCVIAGQVGMAGSCELGDFVVMGGQAGLADHASLGDGARVGGKGGALSGRYEGGRDYGGFPLRPIGEWRREMAVVARLARRPKKDDHG